jgi:hypothetical protein
LDKLEKSVSDSAMMCIDDDEATTPPQRPKRFTISYAQATKRLAFGNEMILTPPTTVHSQKSMTATTTTSSLTQESLEELLRRFRLETDNSIASFCQEIQNKFLNIKELIVSAVSKAIQIPTPEINAPYNNNDNNSNYSTAQESTNTTSTLTDKVDNLTEIVLMLSKDLQELRAERDKGREPQKRTRSLLPTPPKINTPQQEDDDNANKSPPSKLPRSRAEESPTIKPPRHPMQQLTARAMEES